MKAIIRLDKLQMIIESPNANTRPTIKGDLFNAFSGLDLQAWLFFYKQPELHKYIEIDFALALTKDKMLKVDFVEPIQGYQAGEYNVV